MKLKVTNYRHSPLKMANVGKPFEVECQIIRKNKKTALIYVPKWDKELVVKLDKLDDETAPH